MEKLSTHSEVKATAAKILSPCREWQRLAAPRVERLTAIEPERALTISILRIYGYSYKIGMRIASLLIYRDKAPGIQWQWPLSAKTTPSISTPPDSSA
jgi:hypothetical protein